MTLCRLVSCIALMMVLLQWRFVHAEERLINTPANAKAWVRGNCLVVESRSGNRSVNWLDLDCDKNVIGDIGAAFEWFPDFLNQAIDFAEEIACGKVKCAFPTETVRIYVTWGQVPELSVLRGRGANPFIKISMTTSLVQVAEGVVKTYLDELRFRDGGGASYYTNWLKQIDSMSGGSCVPVDVPRWPLPLTMAEFVDIRKLAQTFYTFVFMHELAHQLLGPACQAKSGADALTQELACDRYAFDTLIKQPVLLPSFSFVAEAVFLAHYQLVLDPLLGQLAGGAGRTYSEQFPATDWHKRAVAIVNRWEEYCRSGAQNRATCREGWKTDLADTRRILDLSLPGPCGG